MLVQGLLHQRVLRPLRASNAEITAGQTRQTLENGAAHQLARGQRAIQSLRAQEWQGPYGQRRARGWALRRGQGVEIEALSSSWRAWRVRGRRPWPITSPGKATAPQKPALAWLPCLHQGPAGHCVLR